MASITWKEVLTQSVANGPTVFVVSGRVSCIPTPNRITLPNCYFYPGLILRIRLSGILQSVATNVKATVRLEVGMGPGGTTIVFDSGPIELVSRNVLNPRPFVTVIDLVCRAVGIDTQTTFFPTAWIQAEALAGSPTTTTGGNPSVLLPYNTPTTVGGGTDSTAASTIDVFCTVKGTNPNFQCLDYRVEAFN